MRLVRAALSLTALLVLVGHGDRVASAAPYKGGRKVERRLKVTKAVVDPVRTATTHGLQPSEATHLGSTRRTPAASGRHSPVATEPVALSQAGSSPLRDRLGLDREHFRVNEGLAYLRGKSSGLRRQLVRTLATYAAGDDVTARNARALLAELAPDEPIPQATAPERAPDALPPEPKGRAAPTGLLARRLGLAERNYDLDGGVDHVLGQRKPAVQRSLIEILRTHASDDDPRVAANARATLEVLSRRLAGRFKDLSFTPRPRVELPLPEPYVGPREKRFVDAAAIARQPQHGFLEGARRVPFEQGTVVEWIEERPSDTDIENSRAVAKWRHGGKVWAVKFTPYLPPDKLRMERQVQAVMNELGHGPRLASFVVHHPRYGYGIAMELLPAGGQAWLGTAPVPAKYAHLPAATRARLAADIRGVVDELRQLVTEGVALKVGDPQFWVTPSGQAMIFDFGEWSIGGSPSLLETSIARMADQLER